MKWMSPELLSPDDFDMSHANPTIASDVYALGMVILEVIRALLRLQFNHLMTCFQVLIGAQPFAELSRTQNIIIYVVVNGKRPARPANSEKMGISDALWQLLQSCWTTAPAERAGVKFVRKFLQEAASTWHLRLHVQVPSHNDGDVRGEASSSTSSGGKKVISDNDANDDVVSDVIVLTLHSIDLILV